MDCLGTIFKVMTAGESHGKANLCIVSGCPAGIRLSKAELYEELERDVPCRELGTPRKESNQGEILSGINDEGITLGTPIGVLIRNSSQKKKDYSHLKGLYRPGHAEFTYHERYGIYSESGGGRASGRECISRLVAGAIAKKILQTVGVKLESHVEEMGGFSVDKLGYEEVRDRCLKIGGKGDSTGGVVRLIIKGVPAGIGSPVFRKLDADICQALKTIGGTKGVEVGLGFESARVKGSQFNDPLSLKDGKTVFMKNDSGGFLGGISTGMDMIFRIAVKPTPSISVPQTTVNRRERKDEYINISGRFDINFTPRVAPVAEAMAAIVLVDHLMLSGVINSRKISN